ncbi:hypothetical protein BCR37DRAFT_99819 [Protomyces lactucae-debilis]|uniref:Uncharacterized protein n=1 Tax=Protomyces lactucae-debilis TaxID=2754530 RepID=A0A1Y2F5P6_PROLT|nr:uncharacterized protein BCR37DRAFT_99819 [Protomyces lactucae-debilis]ORY78977.1 hypothetical protein BCR37DRAFT_99819 [Protomyces lactucae-debilis]
MVWSWLSTGSKSHGDMSVQTLRCQGLLICSNPLCAVPQRVIARSRTTKFEAQVSKACGKCQSSMNHIQCAARRRQSFRFDGQQKVLVELEGRHSHAVPPNTVMKEDEKAQLLAMLQANPGKSATQLKFNAGTCPESGKTLSALSIHPGLGNRNVLRYQARKLDPGGMFGGSHGGNSFLRELVNLTEAFPATFVEGSCFFRPTRCVVIQSPDMKEAVFAGCSIENNQGGYISDAAHGFFRDALLMVTCAFVPIM